MTNSVNSAKDLDSILFDISPKIKELEKESLRDLPTFPMYVPKRL